MTGHRTWADRDDDGITVGCDDCTWRITGLGNGEWASLEEHNHQLETKVEALEERAAAFDQQLRLHAAEAERIARRFPAGGGHYGSGYAAALRFVLNLWAPDETVAAMEEMRRRLEPLASHDERVAAVRQMSRETQRQVVLRRINGGAS